MTGTAAAADGLHRSSKSTKGGALRRVGGPTTLNPTLTGRAAPQLGDHGIEGGALRRVGGPAAAHERHVGAVLPQRRRRQRAHSRDLRPQPAVHHRDHDLRARPACGSSNASRTVLARVCAHCHTRPPPDSQQLPTLYIFLLEKLSHVQARRYIQQTACPASEWRCNQAGRMYVDKVRSPGGAARLPGPVVVLPGHAPGQQLPQDDAKGVHCTRTRRNYATPVPHSSRPELADRLSAQPQARLPCRTPTHDIPSPLSVCGFVVCRGSVVSDSSVATGEATSPGTQTGPKTSWGELGPVHIFIGSILQPTRRLLRPAAHRRSCGRSCGLQAPPAPATCIPQHAAP